MSVLFTSTVYCMMAPFRYARSGGLHHKVSDRGAVRLLFLAISGGLVGAMNKY